MIYICLASLLILGAWSACNFAEGPSACADAFSYDGECCIWDEDATDYQCIDASGDDCIIMTEAPFSSTEELCDNSDLTEWRTDYIGKSTQFRIYDPCDNKFIKFKMEDLTEFSAATGKKTNNKETSFASSKDWEWGEDSGTVVNYQGNDAIYNAFNADALTKTGSLLLETRFFMQDAEMIDPDTNETITIKQNSLKFDVTISNWDYLDTDNYLVLCIGVMTNKAGDIDDDPDTKTFYLQEFTIENIETATCTDSGGNDNTMNVNITRDGNGNNHLDLCYTFEPCDGTITYDPIVSPNDLGGNGNTWNVMTVFLSAFIAALYA